MIVVLVIIVAFVKALEQMGLLEDTYEGRMLKESLFGKAFVLKIFTNVLASNTEGDTGTELSKFFYLYHEIDLF